jgi:hypothetical protein
MRYHIVCTDQEPVYLPTTHAHIVAVGTGNNGAANIRWTLDQVLVAMDRGDVFYTQSPTTGKVAYVHKYQCADCRRTYIRSTPDAVYDNNLDNLRRCAWQR